MRNFELPGRSPVYATGGMAATSHPLATLTAVDVLRDGGNAVDAAVAACAVLGVVEPFATGIGGDCFAIIAPKGSADLVAYNGSGRAPAKATPEWFAEHEIDAIERTMPHAVTVPGAIDAWTRLIADYGRKSLKELLEPAIRYAHNGYPIYPRVARQWMLQTEILSGNPNAANMLLVDGEAPKSGTVHRQPLLASTLERIACEGRDGFYTGPIAEDIVGYLSGLGGLHTMEDFAAATGEYVTPIRTNYRGYEVCECPPNGQGIIALIMLNILSGFDLPSLDPLSVERLHLEIEAARLAYADRDAYLADPKIVEVPVKAMLSTNHADELRARIRLDKAMAEVSIPYLLPHSDTVYLTVVDEERTAVSFINSLFDGFGGGLVTPNSGVTLHCRDRSFSLDPDHPNCIAPGKRPMHTIIPGMLIKGDRAVMPFGVVGGNYQACGHVHVLTNMIDFGLDPQEALDLARVFPDPTGRVDVESGVPADVFEGLGRLGHPVAATRHPLGGGQSIRIDWETGVLCAGSDPRKDGCAIGY